MIERTHRSRGVAVACALVALGGLGCRGTTGASGMATLQAQGDDIARADFTPANEARRPHDWRSWVFVGAPLTPNALNGGSAPFPEFHNVYIEPSAFRAYRRTGRFPEGTQLVKELVTVVADGAREDGSTRQVSGRGYFQDAFQGLELLVKESARFPEEPGGWVFFSFGHHEPPYAETAPAMPTASCNTCHETSAADDYVFTQFYPVLRAAKRGSAP